MSQEHLERLKDRLTNEKIRQLKWEINRMECAYDNLFTDKNLMDRYNDLQKQLSKCSQ